MCGIAGFVGQHERADPRVIEPMLELLAHRGPDSHGAFVAERAAIGQTRLAIIDLVTGDPPIATPNERIGVAFNGEIYNYRELREGLLRDGHTLRTTGDTEIIAHLAENLDPGALCSRLDGMFTFAVWDLDRQRLVLARDRLGKKPLYWWSDGRQLVFASEIKAMLAHPAVPRDLDSDAIPAYLTFGYVPTPRTFFKGIASLPPGHVLEVTKDLSIRIFPFWQPEVPRPSGVSRLDLSMGEAAAAIRDELGHAVRRRMVSDVPLGAFLSGGVDSSAVVALMARESQAPVRTFTIGFDDDDGFDERAYAAMVARQYGTDHEEFVVSPRAVDLVEKLAWHYDQPFGDSSAVPTYLLSELTKKHVTVALSGDGGDELFAGYERFAAALAVHRWNQAPALARRGASGLVARLPGAPLARRLQRFAGAANLGLPDALREWISYVPAAGVDALSPGTSRWHLDDYQEIWESSAGASTLDRLLHLNLRTYLLDDLLPKVDRMSMAHGLEVRSPFLDHHLVELALRLPPATKLRRMSLKRCLKVAVADLLPTAILDRPKKGFGVPLARWFRDDLASYVSATLGSPDSRVRHHLEPAAIDRLLNEHGSGVADHGHALWTLLTLETFLRRHGW